MMKPICLFLFAVLTATLVAAQQAPCAFDGYMAKHRDLTERTETIIRSALNGPAAHGSIHYSHLPGLKIIPVVVHVIHNGGPENISDSQVISQLKILNEDFRRIAGTPGYGTGVDAEIEFCLARKDPYGRCTNGIIRVQSTLSDHKTFQRSMLKELSYWDNTRYLNVYVVKDINSGSGILGYASFPGGPPDEDGIVVRHDYFGNIGTAAGSMGRTTTHEIGHWFGLYHTFNGGCGTDTCTTGDMVCDTPPVSAPNFGCPTINSCTNDSYPDQTENYLDYTDDACKSKFTLGQKNRMHAALSSLRPDVWAAWNTDSTGCDSGFVNGPCSVIADFIALNRNICAGTAITLYNRSQNVPATFSWSFPGGTPAVSSLTNPTVSYSVAGSYSIKLVATNATGSDTLEFTNYVTVSTPPIGQPLPYYEGFETSSFPPAGMVIDNPDGGVTWERDMTALPYAGMACARINNLVNTNYGQSDAMVLPGLDMTTASGTQFLYFYWAYARSDPSYSDELVVLASRDCGVTWTQLFYRTGTPLATGPTQTTPYIPDTATVWKTAKISLAAFATARDLTIKFVNVTDGGNNLYIDNIGIGTAPLGVADKAAAAFSVYPNPVSDLLTVDGDFQPGKLYMAELINSLGQRMLQGTFYAGRNTLDLSTLAPAVYQLRVFCDGVVIGRKVVVKDR